MCTVISGPGNTRHFGLLLGAQFKVKLWSWESPFPGSRRQSWIHMTMDERENDEKDMMGCRGELGMKGASHPNHPGLTLLPAQLREALRCSPKRPTPALTPEKGEPPAWPPRTYLLPHSHRAAFTRICTGWLVRTPPGGSPPWTWWCGQVSLLLGFWGSSLHSSGTSGQIRGSVGKIQESR